MDPGTVETRADRYTESSENSALGLDSVRIARTCTTVVDETLFPPECDADMMKQLAAGQSVAIQKDYPDATQVTFLGQGVQGITYRVTLLDGTEMTAKVSNMAVTTYVSPSTEQEIKSRLNHEHLCRHIKSSTHDDTGRYIDYYEYAQGDSLQKYLRDHGSLPTSTVVAILQQLAEALDHCLAPDPSDPSTQPVYHRDLKPSNVIISVPDSGPPRVKLIDFGVAKLGATQLTINPDAAGSLTYMAPEAIFTYTAQSDQYSLGVIAIQCLLGSVPEHLESNRLSGVPYSIPSYELTDAPSSLKDLVNRLLSRKPENRFRDYKELLKALREISEGMESLPGWTPAASSSESSGQHLVRPVAVIPGGNLQEVSQQSCVIQAIDTVCRREYLLAEAFNVLEQLRGLGASDSLGAGQIRDALRAIAKSSTAAPINTTDERPSLGAIISEFGSKYDLTTSGKRLDAVARRFGQLERRESFEDLQKKLLFMQTLQSQRALLEANKDRAPAEAEAERQVASLIYGVLLLEAFIPMMEQRLLPHSGSTENTSQVTANTDTSLSHLSDSTFMWGYVTALEEQPNDRYETYRLKVTIFTCVKDSAGDLKYLCRRYLSYEYYRGNGPLKALREHVFSDPLIERDLHRVYYNFSEMQQDLINALRSGIPIDELTECRAPELPEQWKDLLTSRAAPPGAVPGAWKQLAQQEQDELDRLAAQRKAFDNMSWEIKSRLDPNVTFRLSVKDIQERIVIVENEPEHKDSEVHRGLLYSDGIRINPETGLVTIGIKTGERVQWIDWARVDMLNKSLCILPPDACQVQPRKPGLLGRILGGFFGSEPDTRQYFHVTYSVSESKPDPRRNNSFGARRDPYELDYFEESRYSTGGAYVEAETGLLRVSPTTHRNITLSPHIMVDPPQLDGAPSLQVVWRERHLDPELDTTKVTTRGYRYR